MIDEYYSDPATVSRMREGPVGPFIDEYAAHVQELGFERQTIRKQLRIAGKLSLWLQDHGHDLHYLDNRCESEFAETLGVDRFPGGSSQLRQLFEYLRGTGRIVRPSATVVESTPLSQELVGFRLYLREERGLQEGRVHAYNQVIEKFLKERFPAGPIPYQLLKGSDAIDFAVRHAFEQSPARSRYMVSALRAFLRFLRFRGVIETDLASCVPIAAHWKFSSVPDYLERHELSRVLDSCDRATSRGRRTYAILLLLVRLALRAGEVARLELADISWRSGEIRIRGKGGEVQALPLPPDVGEAIADYLSKDRPKNACRKVFLNIRAPIRGVKSASISYTARKVLLRVGVGSRRKGSHVLRHTAATMMLRSGVTLPQVGEALRHARLDTTRIYAKVDFEALRALAQPWPEATR